jgi:hypothetical protein
VARVSEILGGCERVITEGWSEEGIVVASGGGGLGGGVAVIRFGEGVLWRVFSGSVTVGGFRLGLRQRLLVC